MSLQSAFSVKLSHKILPKTVSHGKFDGTHPSLAAATTAGKIFLHNPNQHSVETGGRLLRSDESDISLLNINQQVRSLAAGRLNPAVTHDIIIIGTSTHVLAYDVYSNSDLFYKEVADGVNCIAIGKFGDISSMIAILGGNCAIQGYDYQGKDHFWTVTGNNVTALCLCDFDSDGKAELIVGSEDFDIKVYKHDEIICEMTETEAVTLLLAVGNGKFAYALSNGTLGVYEGTNRTWRIKSKNNVTSMLTFNILGQGDDHLIVGWSNGKIDFRLPETGEVILKESMNNCIAGMVVADYRMDGHTQLICCSTDGEVRGYLPLHQGGQVIQTDTTQEVLRDLALKRQNLMLELFNYEENLKAAEVQRTRGSSAVEMEREQLGVIPANTQLQTTLYVNPGSETEQPCVELYVSSSNGTLVRAVIVFAEGIFPGESYIIHPNQSQLQDSLKVQLRPEKDVAVDLHIKALVGSKGSVQFHVFELSRALPRFSMYALCNDQTPLPESYVNFSVVERPQRLALWINEQFLMQDEFQVGSSGNLDARFFSLRGKGLICIQMDSTGQVFVRCDDMELCSEVIQALADFLGIQDLNTIAEFPKEIECLMNILEQVNALYATRDQLSAELADQAGLIKGLLVRAEDSRLICDIINMKKYYSELYAINQQLIGQYKIRCTNHEQLLQFLKQVNQIIQRAGRLRVGKPKTEVINACRDAIADANFSALPKIIRVGTS